MKTQPWSVRFFTALAFATTDGCASPTGADAGSDRIVMDVSADAGASASTDANDVNDVTMDAPRDALETGAASTDAQNDQAAFDDVVIDYGSCGMAVRACLCTCGASATCQSGCINGDVDCGACVYGAGAACCPAEESAFSACVDRYMCVDQACVTLNCASQEAAFSTCFQRRQSMVATCTHEVQTCLGSDFPAVRCVTP